MGDQGKLSRRGFVGAAAGTAVAGALGAPRALAHGGGGHDGGHGGRLLVRNPAGSFSTAERSYDYLAALRERFGGRSTHHHR